MIVGVPVYAVVKTVVEYWRNIRVLRENGDLEEFKEVPVQWHLPHPKDKQ
jgi:predicted PurR-regulated permease PerM